MGRARRSAAITPPRGHCQQKVDAATSRSPPGHLCSHIAAPMLLWLLLTASIAGAASREAPVQPQLFRPDPITCRTSDYGVEPNSAAPVTAGLQVRLAGVPRGAARRAARHRPNNPSSQH